MKAYSCNWFTFFLGVLLSVGVLQWWGRYVCDCLTNPDKVLPLRTSIGWSLLHAVGWTLICFFAAQATDKMLREARETTEDAPVKSQTELSHTGAGPTEPLRKKVLLGTFGIASAIAGGASLVVHLWNGSIGAGQVVLFVLAVPASVTLGVWLMQKAKLELPSKPVLTAYVAVSQSERSAPTMQCASVLEEAGVVAHLQQGDR